MGERLRAAPRLRAEVGTDGRRRWLAELHPEDLRRYEREVARLTPAIEHALGPQVFANRTGREGRLGPIGPARGAWHAAISAAIACDLKGAAVLSDVRDCYASIRPEVVERSLVLAGIARADREPTVRLLDSLAREGLRGLPIGPSPSAILANGVLAPADRAVRLAGATVLRWVDDVVILAASPAAAARGFDAWAAALRVAGLRPNEAKTRRIGEVGACEALVGRISRAVGEPVP